MNRNILLALTAAIISFSGTVSAEDRPWPVLPKEGPLLFLPKGMTVSVSGMTSKNGRQAPQDTVVEVKWDDNALTAEFKCEDSSVGTEWAKERDSSKTWKDDSVALLLDLGHKHVYSKNFLSFKLSAGGGLQDSRGVTRDPAYTINCSSSVKTTDKGWTGTITIPWKELGSKPAEGDIWGINFTRIDNPHPYAGSEKMLFLSWVPFKEDFEYLPGFGHILFAASDAQTDSAALTTEISKQHEKVAADSIYPREGFNLLAGGENSGKAENFTTVPKNEKPRQPTTVTANWDDKALELIFDCIDADILGEQQGQDNIKLWKDDSVYVYFDPGHKHTQARDQMMIQVSASGAVFDTKNNQADFNFEGADVKTSRSDKGWQARISIPWKAFGTGKPDGGDVWGINFMRMDQPGKIDFENMQSSSWIPVVDGDVLAVDTWGHLIFGSAEADLKTAGEKISKDHKSRTSAINDHNI